VTTYYHDITRKVQDAVEGIINALKGAGGLEGWTIYKGGGVESQTAPRIELICEAEVSVDGEGNAVTGNYDCTVTARVVSNAKDTSRVNHYLGVAQVADIFFYDEAVAEINKLTGTTGLTAFRWNTTSQRDDPINENETATTITAYLFCMPQ